MKTIIKMAASCLYAGYSPVASGTVCCLWGVLIYLNLYRHPLILIIVTMLLHLIGFLVCTRAEQVYGKKDSHRIVIDELASMCLVYLFIKPTWFMLGLGFLSLRFFDIIKPPPARWLQALPGGKAVMLDDTIAALYAIAVLFIAYFAIENIGMGAGLREMLLKPIALS